MHFTTSKVSLLIAGNTPDFEYAQELTKKASTDLRIHLKLGWIDNQILHAYLHGADVVVLPFRNIITSGTALMAFSYGKPVIAPRMGCLPELIDDQSGVLYDPEEANGLLTAMMAAYDLRDELPSMGKYAYQKAQSFSWSKIGAMTARVYQGETGIGW